MENYATDDAENNNNEKHKAYIAIVEDEDSRTRSGSVWASIIII